MSRWFPLWLATFVLLIAGCSTAPEPTTTPLPTNTPAPTATPSPPTVPAPLENLPSALSDSLLQAYITLADETLCTEKNPRELALHAERSTSPDEAAACLKRLRPRETTASNQQRMAFERGNCLETPIGNLNFYRSQRNSELWALDSFATAYLGLANQFMASGETALANEAYQTIINYYGCGFRYDLAAQQYESVYILTTMARQSDG